MIIEGISLVGNYRSQFNSILNKFPFSHLIERLEDKIKSSDKMTFLNMPLSKERIT